MLIPELKNSPSNKPDGTVKDSLRMARGYWEAKDSHDDLDAEIKVKFNRGYPRDNIIFEDSQTAVLVQNGNEAMRVDMSRDGELHRLIRIFLLRRACTVSVATMEIVDSMAHRELGERRGQAPGHGV